jgi:hypothetical protein
MYRPAPRPLAIDQRRMRGSCAAFVPWLFPLQKQNVLEFESVIEKVGNCKYR